LADWPKTTCPSFWAGVVIDATVGENGGEYVVDSFRPPQIQEKQSPIAASACLVPKVAQSDKAKNIVKKVLFVMISPNLLFVDFAVAPSAAMFRFLLRKFLMAVLQKRKSIFIISIFFSKFNFFAQKHAKNFQIDQKTNNNNDCTNSTISNS